MIQIKYKYLHVILILMITILTGCGTQNADNNADGNSTEVSYQDITPEEAKERLENEEGIILLDVRTLEEYETSHIKDSVLIPVDELEAEASEELDDKESTIFIYCRSGNRSVTAANILINLGYKNVYNLGGINDWPYEVENDN